MEFFLLVPRMLLEPTEETGQVGKEIFNERMRKFLRGEWGELLAQCGQHGVTCNRKLDADALQRIQLEQAEAKVRLREISRARVHLMSDGVAPGNAETLNELEDPDLRPRVISEAIPDHILNFVPAESLRLDPDALLAALRSAGRGSAQDLGGMRYEHLRVLIDDDDLWGAFALMAQSYARAEMPVSVMQATRLGRMTALKKDNGRIRGIVASSLFRRLVCKTVARQYAEIFMESTAPFQYALQTKAGTEALAHALRYLAENDNEVVIIS